MNIIIPSLVFGVLIVVWGISNLRRSKQIRHLRMARAQARSLLTTFSQDAMAKNSIHEITVLAGSVACKIFGSQNLLMLEENEAGHPVATLLSSKPSGSKGQVLTPPPMGKTGLIAWFQHNPSTVFAADLVANLDVHSSLQTMMDSASVDVIMPLVHRGEVLVVLGLSIGRSPSHLDRELLRIFRLEVTAACANVHLHNEVSYLHSLADEVNVAAGLELSMVPKEMSGRLGPFTWEGHFESAEQAGSDFWGMYSLEGEQVLIVIGDSVGRRLAGSMVSAAVKSCCDQIVADSRATVSPAEVLSALNFCLFRNSEAALASCAVALLDPKRGEIRYANAGHQLPYRLRRAKDAVGICVLSGSGPLLGDQKEPRFQVHTKELASSDSLLFLTNGLLAPRDAAGQAFGHRRLHKLLKGQSSTDNVGLQKAILSGIAAHSSDAKLRDDQALLLVKWC